MGNRNLTMALFTVLGLALMIVIISSCTSCSKSSENYVTEFTGNNPNYKSCSKSYRLYMNAPNDPYNPRNRCQMCKGYNNFSYEAFENPPQTSFKPCPHNCRQYGVALCDQGTIM